MNKSHIRYFLDVCVDALDAINRDHLAGMVQELRALRDRSGRLFLLGSGGGAGHASHAACDFRKLCGIEAYCVTDNVSELTAQVNDCGWDEAYANWLRESRLSASDALLVFSVGGGCEDPPVSTNLVQAVKLAQQLGTTVLGVVGPRGGYVAEYADVRVVLGSVPPELATPVTEGMQAVVWHLLVSHPDLQRVPAKWEGLASAPRDPA